MLRRALLSAACCAALVFAACGGDSGGPDDVNDFSSTPRDPARNLPPDQVGLVNVIPAGSDWYVGENNFVFGITNAKDEPQGGAKAVVTFYDLREPGNPNPRFSREAVQSAPGVGKEVQHRHQSGEVHLQGGRTMTASATT